MITRAFLFLLLALPLTAQVGDSTKLKVQALEDSIGSLNNRLEKIGDRWSEIEKAADKPAEWLKWFVGVLLGLASAAVVGSVFLGIYNAIRVERDLNEVTKLKKQAQADYEEIRRMKDEVAANSRGTEGYYSLSTKNYEQALEAFEKAIRIKPDSPEVHVARGMALSDLGRHEEALEAF